MTKHVYALPAVLVCSIVSMMSPEDSWVAKWQRISQYTFMLSSVPYFPILTAALWLSEYCNRLTVLI